MTTKYPNVHVRLTGEDGNIFFIIARVNRALERAGISQAECSEFCKAVGDANSYDEALQTVMRYVSVS